MLFKNDSAAREQHLAVRNNIGWYRWTHDLVEVKGKDAGAFLDYLYVNSIYKAPVGRTKYTTMLNEEGQIIDDVIVMHMEENLYWVTTLYAPQLIKWMDDHKGSYDVEYSDITKAWDMYSVQGPNSKKMIEYMTGASIEELKRFAVMDGEIAGVAVKLHRSGFTGEDGYEIYCTMEDTAKVHDAIKAAEKPSGAIELTILEVYVRSLPVEKGFALRQDMYKLSPYGCGLGWSVDLEKDFIGKEATVKFKEEGVPFKLVGFELEAESYEDIAQLERIKKNGIPVGFVRTTIYGYSVEKNIGFAVIEPGKVEIGDRVTIGTNDSPAVITAKSWLK